MVSSRCNWADPSTKSADAIRSSPTPHTCTVAHAPGPPWTSNDAVTALRRRSTARTRSAGHPGLACSRRVSSSSAHTAVDRPGPSAGSNTRTRSTRAEANPDGLTGPMILEGNDLEAVDVDQAAIGDLQRRYDREGKKAQRHEGRIDLHTHAGERVLEGIHAGDDRLERLVGEQSRDRQGQLTHDRAALRDHDASA